MNGRHRLVRRHRRSLGLLAATSLVAGLSAVATVTAAPPASAADPCVTPTLRDVMVSQGLPSYSSLTRGKTTLARFYLSTPSCIPTGTTVNVKAGSLTISSSPVTVPITAPLPLPPLGPITTSPIQQSAADPYFSIPGALINPATTGRSEVFFSATLDFDVKRDGQVIASDRVTFSNRPGSTTRISAFVEGVANPLRVLVVPMGDLGTDAAPKTAASQFPPAATSALQRGMNAVSRVMPLRDGVSDLLAKTGGLQYTVSGGMVDLNGLMPGGVYCGVAGDFSRTIEPKLTSTLNAWNKENPAAYADRVLGVIWQGVSRGPNTDANSASCLEGYASFSSGAAWARVIDERAAAPARSSLTGSLAVMELAHTVGDVAVTTTNNTRHSLELEADGTAKDRAFNIANQQWIRDDRTSQRFQTDSSWHDDSTLLEPKNWSYLQCYLTTPAIGAPTNTNCPSPGGLGGNAAASADLSGSFFLAGSTDGTPQGTEVDSYFDDNTRYEPPVDSSSYRLVQRDALGGITLNSGVAVNFTHSDHSGNDRNHTHVSTAGTFGTELESDADTVRIEFWKGNPATDPAAVLLYSRNKGTAPQFLSVQVGGTSVTISATADQPQDLRLYAHHVCPGGANPIFTNQEGITVGRTTVFVERVDTTLSCPGGRMLFTLGDGYLTAQQSDTVSTVGGLIASAAIYEPGVGAVFTVKKAVALSGAARDSAGRSVDDLRWTLAGPSFPTPVEVARGSSASYRPPSAGLIAGTYVLTLEGRDANGLLVTSASRSLDILGDRDLDGLADVVELQITCSAGAADNPLNAVGDSDFDGVADIVDLQPCVTTSNIGVDFNPNSLNTGSQGNTFSAKISGSPIDLRTLPLSAYQVLQVAGYDMGRQPDGTDTTIQPLSVHAESATSATVKFNRSQLNAFLQAKQITGNVPIFIGSTAAGLRGVDTTAPGAF